MLRIICDRCGKEIPMPGRTGYLAWNFRNGHGGDLIGKNALEDRDYCETCMGAIFDFIERKTGAADASREAAVSENREFEKAEEEMDSSGRGQQAQIPKKKRRPAKYENQEVPVETKGRKKVDIGKILALRNAGWGIARIADDESMTEAAVRTAIYRHEKRIKEESEEE